MDEKPIKDPTKTRFDANIFESDNPQELIGYYLADNIGKTWQEEFTDGDTGEIVTVERHERLFNRGALITADKASSLAFHIAAGDIATPIIATDQQRQAEESGLYGLKPFSVTAQINRKKYKFIIQAQSVDLALAVARDYIELNYDGIFALTGVSYLNQVVILNTILERLNEGDEGKIVSDPDSEAAGDRFYKADAEVRIEYMEDVEGQDLNFTFIVKTPDIDAAKAAATAWIANRVGKDWQGQEVKKVTTTLTAAVPYSCTAIINRAFCEAYKQPTK